MTESADVINYVYDRFMNHGVVAERDMLALVFQFQDDYYKDEKTSDGNPDLGVAWYSRQEVVDHILTIRPDLDAETLNAVFDAELDFAKSKMKSGGETNESES